MNIFLGMAMCYHVCGLWMSTMGDMYWHFLFWFISRLSSASISLHRETWPSRWRISRTTGKKYGNHYTNLATMLTQSAVLYSVFSMLSQCIIPFSLKHPIQNAFILVFSEKQTVSIDDPPLMPLPICMSKSPQVCIGI
ncbi:uncharacterized protein EV420DRAFT_862763 [Desarmillaria tabescens]|uniref:Uncharacterized protein n=1 Tax=Armillaria tabescens TaxID=1929756 RepID=A0AA39MVL8_ARMTA|nr:uncharacterized protein EV420DRAFT_862763 [Desarmillaria tabescens]KAK0447858.1 hypothetical protein EV420DRAFT_862763 [Desarmillaria tabescens]